ncbi:hypothetical protein F5Y04DRAFT_280286 [Hypomontagnella monticulosa]|nr:hypothetical protein F5Y04DRAFT_280286 [Hypomontagnella monticulosa]
MRALWYHTNIMISVINDVLSLRKEIRLGCIDNIVPVIFASTNNLREAVSLSVAALRAAKEGFDEAAKDLLTERAEREESYKHIQAFIEVERSNCVGNLIWSLETQRYNVSGVMRKDGSLDFAL